MQDVGQRCRRGHVRPRALPSMLLLVVVGVAAAMTAASAFILPGSRVGGASSSGRSSRGVAYTTTGRAQKQGGATTTTALSGKKRRREQDWEEVLAEAGGEREEGIWPTAPAPWEASFMALDPLMLDPEDLEDEEEGMMEFLERAAARRKAKEEEEAAAAAAAGHDPAAAALDDSEEGMEGDVVMEVEQAVELSLGSMDLPEDFDDQRGNAKAAAAATLNDLLMERALRFYERYDGERTTERERCYLVGVARKRDAGDPEDAEFTVEESLTELSELVGTAGLEVAGSTYQKVHDFNTRTCIGSGKVAQIKNQMAALGCRTVIVDEELTPSQQMNLENSFGGEKAGIKVLDRTALILDIFAQHAKTKEGKLQVELALMMYRLPRLTRLWTHLERQSTGGGATGSVGLRGPGESQLESDKRIIRRKIAALKKELLQLHRHRSLHRVRREKMGYPVVALVGYTNSGKSTLLNSLTQAGALAEDLMFATLDPTTRKLALPQFQGSFPEILLTDTVGFIQKLPTQLIAAFRATLEEIYMADVLVHLVDASNPMWRKHKASVDATLEDMGVAHKPRIVMYNKVDSLSEEEAASWSEVVQLMLEQGDAATLAANGPATLGAMAEAEANEDEEEEEKPFVELSVAGSGRTGQGVLDLLRAIDEALRSIMVHVEVLLPYSEASVLSQIHDRGSCDKVLYQGDGTYVAARVPQDLAYKLLPYRVDAGARQHHERQAGEEIDWAALAKGRHTYKERLQRGEVTALVNAQQPQAQQQESASAA